MKIKIKRFLSLMTIVFIAIIAYHNVNKDVLNEDIIYINKYLVGINRDIKVSKMSYEQQLELIKNVQSNVFKISPIGKGIPKFQERRPKDLYKRGYGLCFDRSFVMELIFEHLGFKTRHVSLYENKINTDMFSELMTPKIRSHAISEVKTKKGWVIVDSSSKWLGIDINNLPISMKKITAKVQWKKRPKDIFYDGNQHFAYGIYSRHGNFFKPYNFIPDYNISEIMYNL